MFAVMKDTDYAAKPTFIDNFFTDWRKVLGKNHIIKNFELCDFTPIYEWHLREKERKKQMTTEASVCRNKASCQSYIAECLLIVIKLLLFTGEKNIAGRQIETRGEVHVGCCRWC